MITKEELMSWYERLRKYEETAEQYEYPKLAIIDGYMENMIRRYDGNAGTEEYDRGLASCEKVLKGLGIIKGE